MSNDNLDLEEEGLLVYLIEPEQNLRRDLTRQITYYGYRVLSFARMADAREAADLVYPALVIAGIAGDESDTLMSAADIVSMRENPAPIVYLSERDDPEIRLTAVRSGGKAFFKRPVDPNRLAALLNDLTDRRENESFRVLILDETAQGDLYGDILNDAGMSVRKLVDPREVPGALEEFNPELILLNLYYQGVLGMEVAAMIRQFESAQAVSLVFISEETRLDRKMAVMRTGGDIVLAHPVEKELLLSVVTARVERARILRSLMVRDSLTGLLNHTSLIQTLESWSARAARGELIFSYGIVDIDKFKRVNDTYGHATGDRVIQSLARSLRHHVTRRDVVGRYGGEEFAVLFYGLDGPAAVEQMRGMHDDFARIRHLSDGGEFFTTFSSGLACCTEFPDPGRMQEAADEALYTAKSKGGHRVGHALGRVTGGAGRRVRIRACKDGVPSGLRTEFFAPH